MRRNWVFKGIKVAVLVILAIAVFGFVVMNLWNWLMPAVFGFKAIGFWQAIGLLVLSKLLFGGFHGRHGGGMHCRARMRERWAQMTPEEREKFREGMRRRCGSFRPAETEK
jgi:chromate transport protein ChrA